MKTIQSHKPSDLTENVLGQCNEKEKDASLTPPVTHPNTIESQHNEREKCIKNPCNPQTF